MSATGPTTDSTASPTKTSPTKTNPTITNAVTLRPIRRPDDMAFLFALYASTREEELALVPWPPEHKTAFLEQQFAAQDAHYREHFAAASFDIIELDAVAIGRLYVMRWADEIRIVDIALMPEQRGRGIGGALLRELQAQARAANVPLGIHVERMNPALRLYERLGFEVAADQGVYLLMKWQPSANRAVETNANASAT
jgi:ribosomal protein S18 acetylase RimI-like enzyme